MFCLVCIQAVRTALRMLDDGHSIRDAEAVCGPDVLNQIFKWKVLYFFQIINIGILVLSVQCSYDSNWSYSMIFFHCFHS